MLTEREKEARRSEYKSKQVMPKVRGSAAHSSAASGGCAIEGRNVGEVDVTAASSVAAVDKAVAAHAETDGGYLPPVRMSNSSSSLVQVGGWVPPLTIQALKSHTTDSVEHERIVKLEGISPGARALHYISHRTCICILHRCVPPLLTCRTISAGMTGGAMALLPDAPLLTALSCKTGAHTGGTAVWIQGSRFNARTRGAPLFAAWPFV